jgi:hypothetical protein
VYLVHGKKGRKFHKYLPEELDLGSHACLKFLEQASVNVTEAQDVRKQDVRVLDRADLGLCPQRFDVQFLQGGQLRQVTLLCGYDFAADPQARGSPRRLLGHGLLL